MDARRSAIGPPPVPSLHARALPYATCLSDAEWVVVEPLLPAPAATGRPRRWPMRAVFDGILYVLRTGCAWRHLPLEFPPWGTVHRWFLRLSRDGDQASEAVEPSVGALDHPAVTA